MKLLTYSEYCKNMTAHKNAGYVYDTNGERKYIYRGKSYSPKQFLDKFPIAGKIVASLDTYKGENPDKTKII